MSKRKYRRPVAFWVHWFFWGTIGSGGAAAFALSQSPWLASLVWGLGTGAGQWLVLRRQWELIRPVPWLGVTVLGFLAGTAVEQWQPATGMPLAVAVGFVRGGVAGFFQWTILRFHLTRIHPWPILSGLGWALGAVWLAWEGVEPTFAVFLCAATAMSVTGRLLQQRTWVGETFI